MKKKTNKHVTLMSNSVHETIAFGKNIASLLKPGMIVGLEGPLGSGKTTLTKGIVRGLFRTTKVKVTSPSFVLINHYEGVFPVFHIDCYRLDTIKDYEDIGIDEFLFSKGISIIEWSEKIKPLLPRDSIFITVTHKGENKRKIFIKTKNFPFMTALRKELP